MRHEMSKTAKKWTAAELKARVQRRHPLKKGWFTVTEFCPSSGGGGRERTDAVAVCLYSSRGFAVHGFEVKVSRSDWLGELNDPSKNSLGLTEVDYWWVVAPSVDVVRLSELESRWGLYTCSGRGLRATRRAERLNDEGSSFSRPFVVSLLWKVANFETPGEAALKAAKREGKREAEARSQEFERRRAGCDTELLKRLKKACDRFREKAGISVEHYDGGEIGEIVRAMATKHGRRGLRANIVEARRQAGIVDGHLKAALGQVDAFGKKKTK